MDSIWSKSSDRPFVKLAGETDIERWGLPVWSGRSQERGKSVTDYPGRAYPKIYYVRKYSITSVARIDQCGYTISVILV